MMNQLVRFRSVDTSPALVAAAGARAQERFFGGVQLRIDEQLGVELAIVQADGDVGSRQAITEYIHIGVADAQGAVADEASKQIGQQTHVAILRGPKSL
jgi:hypothetical protein